MIPTFQLGRTDLYVTRTGFGALPIQRISPKSAVNLLRKAVDGGINFFDTARAYTDSEEKIGMALGNDRKNLILASKSTGSNKQQILDHIRESLEAMRTDSIDLYQLHNPDQLPDFYDPNASYAGLIEAKKRGWIRYIGITSHRLSVAKQAVCSGFFDTLQFPLSAVSAEDDLEIIPLCKENNVGLIAMKALCGGLLTNIPAAFAFLRQYANVVPIWGIQKESELAEILSFEKNPPTLDSAMKQALEMERKELSGKFCRGCGYCLPCPAEIPIPNAARMAFLLRRSPYQRFLEKEWQDQMMKIKTCTQCGHCMEHCPYGLNTPELLREMLSDYETFYAQHAKVVPKEVL